MGIYPSQALSGACMKGCVAATAGRKSLEACIPTQAAHHAGQVRPGPHAQAPAPLRPIVQYQGDMLCPGLGWCYQTRHGPDRASRTLRDRQAHSLRPVPCGPHGPGKLCLIALLVEEIWHASWVAAWSVPPNEYSECPDVQAGRVGGAAVPAARR